MSHRKIVKSTAPASSSDTYLVLTAAADVLPSPISMPSSALEESTSSSSAAPRSAAASSSASAPATPATPTPTKKRRYNMLAFAGGASPSGTPERRSLGSAVSMDSLIKAAYASSGRMISGTFRLTARGVARLKVKAIAARTGGHGGATSFAGVYLTCPAAVPSAALSSSSVNSQWQLSNRSAAIALPAKPLVCRKKVTPVSSPEDSGRCNGAASHVVNLDDCGTSWHSKFVVVDMSEATPTVQASRRLHFSRGTAASSDDTNGAVSSSSAAASSFAPIAAGPEEPYAEKTLECMAFESGSALCFGMSSANYSAIFDGVDPADARAVAAAEATAKAVVDSCVGRTLLFRVEVSITPRQGGAAGDEIDVILNDPNQV